MRLKYLFFLLPFLIFNCVKKHGTKTKATDYIVPDAAVIVKINRLSPFLDSLRNNDFLNRWETTGPYQKIIKSASFLKKLDTASSGVLVFCTSENDSLNFLYISDNLDLRLGKDHLDTTLAQHTKAPNKDLESFNIGDISLRHKVDNGLLLIASSEEILENALNQKQHATDPILNKLFEVSDDGKPATVFINAQQQRSLLTNMLIDTDSTLLSEFTDWISLDIESKTNALSLSGLSVPQDTSKRFLKLFSNTRPLPHRTSSFAPIGTDAILSYSFNDFSAFAKNLQQYRTSGEPINALFNAVEEIGLLRIAKEEAVVLTTYGSETMADYLIGMQKGTTTYQGTEVRTLSTTDFLNTAFQPLINGFQARYATILDNSFVFTETKEALFGIIDGFKKGATFDKSPTYKLARETSVDVASIWYLAKAKPMLNSAKDHLHPQIFKTLRDPKLSDYVYSAQIVADGGFFHTNISAQKLTAIKKEIGVRPAFSVQLENPLIGSPQFTINHNNNNNEVVAQDQKNNLYLISSKGDILWKKQLDSRIQGKIHQVDLFKNNRLQLAFTTANQLWVLDRNGKEVAMLCKRFEEGTLNPLAVFDYDKKKEYRLVVTQGTNVFMYDRKGKIVKGFKYLESESPIVAAPKHIVLGSRDYLVFKLRNGTLKILNRRGEVRVRVNQKIAFSANEVYEYQNQFIVTDDKGILHRVDASGNITTKDLELHPDHGMTASNDLLVTVNDEVLRMNDTEILLELGIYTIPKLFKTKKDTYIGITDLQNQKVYLFNSRAEPIPGFPVDGINIPELSDLGNKNQLQLVTQRGDSTLITYKVN